MRIFIFVLTLSLGLVACKSDPYEDKPAVIAPEDITTTTTSTTTTTTTTSTTTTTTTTLPPPPPVFSLDADEVMKFVVGTKGEYIIRGWVPPPGSPVITIKDLPKDATYDPAEERLIWTPINDDIKTYVIKITLKSSSDPVSIMSKAAILSVSKTSTRDGETPEGVSAGGEQ